jgi:TonB family protein
MKKNASVLAILASLLLHSAVMGVIWVNPSLFSVKKHTVTEVELLDAEEMLKKMREMENNARVIVDQNEKAVNDEIDEKAKYLSRNNQRVKDETRARLTDKFRNSDSTGGQQSQKVTAGQTSDNVQEANDGEEAKQKDLIQNRNGLAVGKTLRDFKPDFKIGPKADTVASGGGESASATDDNIEAPIGMETMLSTREFVYFSYYNRIKDKLRQYWEPKIKEKVTRIFRQGRTIASDADKITKVIIILDEKGILQNVQVIGESGVSDLDDAAVEAFRAAAPFPNPPKGIVEKDGLIRIRWDFILEANNTQRIEGLYYANGQPAQVPQAQ